MGALKFLMKLTLLLVLGAALAGVAMMAKRSSAPRQVTFDEWPEVPENPAAANF